MNIGFHLYHLAWAIFFAAVLWYGGWIGFLLLFAIAIVFVTFA